MRIEYDMSKNAANIAKHGMDFDEAAHVFADADRWEKYDSRAHYGEERRICIGAIPANSICGRVYCVVYTMRGQNVRIISARKANEREQQSYYRRFE